MASDVKVFFELEQDEDMYPPVSVESVWANSTGFRDQYVLDNIPFFASVATVGDTVRVRMAEGVRWFEEVTERSSNSLIRIIFFDRSALDRINAWLRLEGCATEYSAPHNLLAVSVPGSVDLSRVHTFVAAEADAGTVDYEEAILR